MSDVQTLPGALAGEIARVGALRRLYEDAQRIVGRANCRPAIMMIDMVLKRAIAAAGSSDIEGQIKALSALREFQA